MPRKMVEIEYSQHMIGPVENKRPFGAPFPWFPLTEEEFEAARKRGTYGRTAWSFTTTYARVEAARESAAEQAAAARYELSPFGQARYLQETFAQIVRRFDATGETHEHLPALRGLADDALPSSDGELVRWVETFDPIAQAAGEAVEAIERRQAEEARRLAEEARQREEERRRWREWLGTKSHLTAQFREFVNDKIVEYELYGRCRELLAATCDDLAALRAWIEEVIDLIPLAKRQYWDACDAYEKRERERRAVERVERAERMRARIARGLNGLEERDLLTLQKDANALRDLLTPDDRKLISKEFARRAAIEAERQALRRRVIDSQEEVERRIEMFERRDAAEQHLERLTYCSRWQGGRAGLRGSHGHRHGYDPDFRRLARREARVLRRTLEPGD